MKTIAFKVHGKNGDYVRATIVPANHSEETRFGLIDGIVIGFFAVLFGCFAVWFLS
ncbi:MAG TPA: hypothetical protein PKA41_12620 [Verrucomicrobiota bacterium]|nr:hypothetical protein [Verrucomicrobiota bacterium]